MQMSSKDHIVLDVATKTETLSISQRSPSIARRNRANSEEVTVNVWQTAINFYGGGPVADDSTPPGKCSETLVLILGSSIICSAVVGSYFISTYSGVLVTLIASFCVILIVVIPHCCRFCTARYYNSGHSPSKSNTDQQSSCTSTAEFHKKVARLGEMEDKIYEDGESDLIEVQLKYK